MRKLIPALFIGQADPSAKDFPNTPRFSQMFDTYKSGFTPIYETNDGKFLYLANLDESHVNIINDDPGITDFCHGDMSRIFDSGPKFVRDNYFLFEVRRVSPISGIVMNYRIPFGEILSGDEVMGGPMLSNVFSGADIMWSEKNSVLRAAKARAQAPITPFTVAPAVFAFCYGVPFVAQHPTEIPGMRGVWWVPPASIPASAFAHLSHETEEQQGLPQLSGAIAIDLNGADSTELFSDWKGSRKFLLEMRNVLSAFLSALACLFACRPKIFGMMVIRGEETSLPRYSHSDFSVIEASPNRLRPYLAAPPRSFPLSLQQFSQILRLADAESIRYKNKKIERFSQSLRYFGIGATNSDNKICLLLTWAALEQIVFNDQATGEITHKLGLALSALFPANDRSQMFAQIKRCYQMRSKIAHGTYFRETSDFDDCVNLSITIYIKLLRIIFWAGEDMDAFDRISNSSLTAYVLAGNSEPFSVR